MDAVALPLFISATPGRLCSVRETLERHPDAHVREESSRTRPGTSRCSAGLSGNSRCLNAVPGGFPILPLIVTQQQLTMISYEQSRTVMSTRCRTTRSRRSWSPDRQHICAACCSLVVKCPFTWPFDVRSVSHGFFQTCCESERWLVHNGTYVRIEADDGAIW